MVKYTIYKDEAGEWRWRAKARNGEIVAEGESYKNRSDVMSAINLIDDSAIVEVE